MNSQDVKIFLQAQLEKQGMTLQDFESHLEKQALPGKDLKDLATFGLEGLGGAGLGLGALLGLGGYGVYKGNQDSTDKINKTLAEKEQYQRATESLRSALLNQQPQV